MSQPVLYKKIRAITDLSVNDFIKTIRLKKAAQLFAQKKYNVSEISYLVGFNDPKYFSREFRKQFGQSPKEYVNTLPSPDSGN
jgi:AraC-like DNA-binding protein